MNESVHVLVYEVRRMVIGEKLWEGKGKSAGSGFIKTVGMEGLTSIYSWSAEMKGTGKAKGIDGNINVTAKMMAPLKGVSASKDQGIFRIMTGDMCVLKGFDLMKMTMGSKPAAVGLWSFMTTSEKLAWLNETVALVTFEAQDPMWMESKITIWEWT
jgi:hypothetical protein